MMTVDAFRRWLFGRPYLLLTLTSLAWAGNAVASRLAVGEISPLALTHLRWVGVCLLLALTMRSEVVAALPVLRPYWPRILAMSAFGYTAFNALMYAAAYTTSAINIGILQGSIPIFVLVGGLAVFGTRIGPLQALGTAATLAGVAVAAARGELANLARLTFAVGDVFMLMACASYAAYTLALRNRPAVPGLAFFAVLAFTAMFLSAPLLAYEVGSGAVLWPSLKGWLILLYVALFPSFISQIFFIRGVELIGPARAGLFVNLVPVFAALLSVLILGEPFHLYHALALALVLGGIWLAEQRSERPARAGAGA